MIDWDKPLRLINQGHVKNPRVFKNTDGANKIIAYDGKIGGGTYYTVVDWKTGKSFEPNGFSVENVPEEPKDHLHLYKCGSEWAVNSIGGVQLQTKEFWETRHWGKPNNIVVKVPT